MKKLSRQKFSILGLALMAATAIMATVLPSNKKDNDIFDPVGSLTESDDLGQFSCTATGIIESPCHRTISEGAEELLSASTVVGGSISNRTTLYERL